MDEMDRTSTRRCTVRLLVMTFLVSGAINFFFNSFNQKGLLAEATRKDEKKRIAKRDDIVVDHGGGRHHLVHVLSPYVVGVDDEAEEEAFYYPLDLNQWATMESIRRALSYAPKNVLRVDVVCAIFESDWEVLSKANLPCHQFVLLDRSTRTQYPTMKPQRDLPFVADLIEIATNYAISQQRQQPSDNITNTSFHVMLTNADIGLSKHLYNNMLSLFPKFDAFSINRVTIPLVDVTATSNATDLLENQIDRLMPTGIKHPGYDFFCIRSSVLQRINFGDFFLGRPPWGGNIDLMLKIMSDKYYNLKSNVRGTFHLGDDQSNWNHPNTTRVKLVTNKEKLRIHNFCPESSGSISDVWGLQNHRNCGQWFLGKNQSQLLPNKSKGGLVPFYVPGFVRPGYEDIYLERYSNYLRHDPETGRPLKSRARSGPTKKTQAQGTFTGFAKKRKQRKNNRAADGGVPKGVASSKLQALLKSFDVQRQNNTQSVKRTSSKKVHGDN